MNRVTYLDRSGYVVTTDKVIMVFDYYTDPSHALHRILEKNADKPVVFFVSHYCPKHFNKSIYEIAQNHRRTYVMSNDVLPQNIPDDLAVAGMSKDDVIENLPGIGTVKAYPSTGRGVSFFVKTSGGETIFHAGEMADELGEETEVESPKFEEKYKGIVAGIAMEHPALDIAFIPVEVSAGVGFEIGAKEFLKAIRVKDFFPITLGNDRKASEFEKDYVPAGTVAHYMRSPGESIDL